MKDLVSLGMWASIAIIAMVFTILFVQPDITGEYIADGTYIQFEPREACTYNGCVFDLELQRQVNRNPYHEPSAGCYCDGEVTLIPLIQRI